MPIKINLTVDKKIYINVFVNLYLFQWKDFLLFIFWLQLLVAQIVVVGDLVAAVVRAVALLVEQPASIHKDLFVSDFSQMPGHITVSPFRHTNNYLINIIS